MCNITLLQVRLAGEKTAAYRLGRKIRSHGTTCIHTPLSSIWRLYRCANESAGHAHFGIFGYLLRLPHIAGMAGKRRSNVLRRLSRHDGGAVAFGMGRGRRHILPLIRIGLALLFLGQRLPRDNFRFFLFL